MAKTVSETRTVINFDRIRLEGNIIATLIQDGTESVTIEVDADMLSRVRTDVGGGELVIGYKNWLDYLFGVKPIRAQIHLKDFRELQVSGSGKVDAASLHGERMSFGVSGSGQSPGKRINRDRPGDAHIWLRRVSAGWKGEYPGYSHQRLQQIRG